MKKYLNLRLKGKAYNAGKAKYDANSILQNHGYSPLYIGGLSDNYIIRQIQLLFSIISLCWKLSSNDTLFVQIPVVLNVKSILYRLLGWKKVRLEILIHDLDSFRDPSASNKLEDYILKRASVIIAHTNAMKAELIKRGIDKDKIEVLYLFDYLTETTNKYKTSFDNKIIFAGNLEKSIFLRDLSLCNNCKFLLYGLPSNNLVESTNVVYKGKFSSEDISLIEGSWGLVWDGDSIETCSGFLGEYLKINSSHKLSLYIASEKPVIVWSKSSLADYVIDNNLGIVVDSLFDINECIKNITQKQHQKMLDSLSHYSQKMRNGMMLGNILEKKNIFKN
jgi:hypothetical protein